MEKSRILENFLDVIESKYTSEATLKTYNNVVENFIYDKHPNSIDCLTSKYIKRYLLEIKNSKSVSSYNQYLSVIKILYRDVLNQKYKVEKIKPIKQSRKLKNLPTYKDVRNALDKIKNIKHKSIILLLLSTGIRMNELINIRILDVDSQRNRILIYKGKGGRSRFVPLANGLIELLRNYYKLYKPKYYLFEGAHGKYSASSVNKIIKKYIGEQCHAHILRHAFCTYMIDKDTNIKRLKNMTGHKSDASLEWYYQYTENSLELNINPINEIAC